MGTIFNAHCTCGYRKENLFLFQGMMEAYTNCEFPFYCESCKSLFIGNLLDDDVLCTDCGKNNVFSYEDQRAGFSGEKESYSWHVMEIEREAKLNEEGNLCPQCGEFSLAFEDAGRWD